MVKKVLVLNSEVSSLVYDEIASGYCERRDFKDLVSFFVESVFVSGNGNVL